VSIAIALIAGDRASVQVFPKGMDFKWDRKHSGNRSLLG
jgi:hypothetical protein